MCIWPKTSAYNKCSKLFFPLYIYSFNLKNLNLSINPLALHFYLKGQVGHKETDTIRP